MHYRKAREVIGRRRWIASDDIQIHLGPIHTDHTSQYTHQPVLNIGKLRRLQCALAVDDYESMKKTCACTEVVRSAVDRIPETLRGIACAGAEQSVGHRAVVVVDDAHRFLCGCRSAVGGGGYGPAGVDLDVAAVDVFAELAGVCCGEGCGGNGSPLAEGS